MKKYSVIFAVLFTALVFGLTSCQQEAETQDVNVVDEYSTSSEYYYTATGTYKSGSTIYTIESADVEVWYSYDKTLDTNYTYYYIYGKLVGKAANATTYSTPTLSKAVYKIGDKLYYRAYDSTTNEYKNVDVSSYFKGKPSDKSFTYTNEAEGTNLTFKRK